MNPRLTLLVLAALTACSPPADDAPLPPSPKPVPTDMPTDVPTAEASAAAPLVPVGTLVGEYRVAGINDATIDAPIGLALSISKRQIAFDGPCGEAAWAYQLAGTRLRTVRIAYPDLDCLGKARVHNLAIAMAGALDSATQASRTPSNGIQLSGGGRSVTLYSQ